MPLGLLVSGAAGLLLAQSDAGSGRAVRWARARAAVASYRGTLDTSGLVEVDAALPATVDPEDLEALCRGRLEAVALARGRAEEALRSAGDWRDPVMDEQRASAHSLLGSVSSFEGDFAAAVRSFESGRRALAPYVAEYPEIAKADLSLLEAVGVSQMRRGELENCMSNMSADRCLFPVRPGGHHQAQGGAQAAFEAFGSYLEKAPQDLQMRYLLNLAAMLSNRHPAGVPKAQLLSESLFRSDVALPRFVDKAREVGLGRRDLAGGTIVDDFDGDGSFDVVFSSVDYCAPLRLYKNRGDGSFEDRSEAANLLGQLGGLNLVQTDYDNDGRLDIFVMRGGWEVPMRNSLLRNNGDGTFSDVTKKAGLSSGAHSTHSVAWADYDLDGWLDVFVGHELTPSQLFRNRGDGTFEDVTARSGVGASAFTKGVVAGDYDGDGLPDLYVSNMFGANFLYHNDGELRFTDVAPRLGVDKPFLSFPTWFFDYDNDRHLDLFVASYPASVAEFVKHYLGQAPAAETLTLYRNRGDGTFADVTKAAGLQRVVPTMGANFGDLDNDGFLDAYLGTGTPAFGAVIPNILLKNDAGRRFVDVTASTGTGHLQKGHGVAFADLDQDGDEDVVLNVGGAVPGDAYEDALFQNPGAGKGNWIEVHLVGVKSNRAAIGARITLRLRGAGEAPVLRYREVTSGGSFGANPLGQHIGLGAATVVDELEVDWPASRTRQVFKAVPVNVRVEIREFADSYATRGRGPATSRAGAPSLRPA